jgi:hypothetical protein
MQTITTIGLDIAKSVFQVHGIDAQGKVIVRRQLKRRHVLAFFQKLPPCLVGIEACASSHYWSRELQALGHTPMQRHPCAAHPLSFLFYANNYQDKLAKRYPGAISPACRPSPLKLRRANVSEAAEALAKAAALMRATNIVPKQPPSLAQRWMRVILEPSSVRLYISPF